MKNIVHGLIAATLTLTLQGAAASAQTAPPPAAPQVGIREPLSNLAAGISGDRFIGDPSRSVTTIYRDAIMLRSILRAGNPSAPGIDGAVLRYRKAADLGTILPGEATNLALVADEQLIYVTKGEGRLDDGTQAWDLKPGITALIPPNMTYRLASTGPDPLQMIMLSSAVATSTAKGIMVRDTAKVQYIEQGVHWNNHSKSPFSDVGERYLIVYLGPMSMAGPHTHTPETEEGWVKISEGPAIMQLGSEIRRWPALMGLLSPNNNDTVHAAFNLSDTETEAWFYFGGRPASAGPPTAPNAPTGPAPTLPPGGGRKNSREIWDSAVNANVAPHPLAPPSAPAKRR